MTLERQYQELLRLKKEIDRKLKKGTDFQKLKELMICLAEDSAYRKLKFKENQLIMLECFFNIWLQEKRKLPDLGVETDIFDKVSSLDDVERKYQRIKYCGLRIENMVPNEYIGQAIEWLIKDKVSGIAVGKIIVFETQNKEENLLSIAQCIRERGDSFNALLLLQYANETFPGREKLLLEEADIWMDGGQCRKALEILGKIENPTLEIRKLIVELQRVRGNDR